MRTNLVNLIAIPTLKGLSQCGISTNQTKTPINKNNMKKIFTLIAIACFALTISAQPGGRKKAWEDYGELVQIFYEDFSNMTTGSVGAPDFNTTDMYIDPPTEYPFWWNINPKYMTTGNTDTTKPNWGGMNVWPAGGCIYLESTVDTEGARISLPNIDGSARGGRVILRFKARTDDGKICDAGFIEGAETNNMGKEWRNFPQRPLGTVTSEWTTFEFMFEEVGTSSIFIIGAALNFGDNLNPIYIDDVELLQIEPNVEAPVPLPHSNYVGSGLTASFQANWNAVEGAEKYLISVFQKDRFNNPTNYFLTDQEADGTSYIVEGVASGATYYYTVSAVQGSNVSLPSAAMPVVDIAQPENLVSTEIENGKYTASWTPVPTAEVYDYLAYYERTVDTDKTIAVTDEPIADLKFPANMQGDLAGQSSTYTSEGLIDATNKFRNQNYDFDTNYMSHLDRYNMTDFKQAGWLSTMSFPMKDCLKLDGWCYQFGLGDAGLQSSDIDLSNNNGEFDIEFESYGFIDEFETMTTPVVAVFNYDNESREYKQSELVYCEQSAEAWETKTAHLTTGSERTIVGIFAVRGAENLLLKNLKINQEVKAGDTMLDPFYADLRTSKTEIEVELPGQVVDANVYHKVKAIRTTTTDNPNKAFDEVIGQFGNLEYVGKGTSTGICLPNVTLSGATVQLFGGQLVVNNEGRNRVEVYNLAGEKVFEDRTGNANVNIPVQQHGTYIVKVGRQTVKVVL